MSEDAVKECTVTESQEDQPLRMAVYIDLHNTEKGAETFNTSGLRLNYRSLVDELSKGCTVTVLRAYDSTEDEDLDDSRLAKVHSSLNDDGFEMVLKKPQVIAEPNGRKRLVQKEVDTSITTDMLMDAFEDRYDVCMVVSGDRDFCPPAEALKKLGKTVKAASFFTPLSDCLKNRCECVIIEDVMGALEAFPDNGFNANYARAVAVDGGESCE